MIEDEKQKERTAAAARSLGNTINLALPLERLEKVDPWGGASSSLSYVYRPSTVDNLHQVFELAKRSGHTVGLRGAGNSYGDANLNSENIILDIRRMNRILDWNPSSGSIRVEPGVTIAQLWQYVIEDGWWPPVVPGTAKPTIGGSAGMNIHGKNAWKSGTIGEHIVEFDLLLPTGQVITCSPKQNSDLFLGAVGGFGMLGVFTSITMKMRRIYSGQLKVHALASRNLGEMIDQFEELTPESDYFVGWIDGFAGGKGLGRGQIHKANYLAPGADPYPSQSLRLENQHQPDTLFGIVPRSIMWRIMRPAMNDIGARFINTAKYMSSRRGHDSIFYQPHVAFHFLLDYVPNWKKSYGPGGLVQYQCFIPEANARESIAEILRRCQNRGVNNYLSVLKRHRSDKFLISHGVDGYSLAMDFRVTPRRRPKIVQLTAELDEIVIDAGGKFYLAKDSTLSPRAAQAYLGAETITAFKEIKRRNDLENILQSNLWRRLFY